MDSKEGGGGRRKKGKKKKSKEKRWDFQPPTRETRTAVPPVRPALWIVSNTNLAEVLLLCIITSTNRQLQVGIVIIGKGYCCNFDE